MKSSIKRLLSLSIALVLCVAIFSFNKAHAVDLLSRSVLVSSSVPLAVTNQNYSFVNTTTNIVGSIEFEFCDNTPLIGTICSAPSGMDASGALLTAETNNTGFSVDVLNTSANRVVLTRVPVATNLGTTTYTLSNIVNPSTPNQTIYVRIVHYASTDTSGPRGDSGAVAFAVVGAFSVGAYVPPFLIFCAAITVALDCSTASGSLIAFGELTVSQTKAATSQFSGATNDPSGYSVVISGQTMTAGNLIIPPLSTNSASNAGISQFGINLRSNTVPNIGAEPTGAGSVAINAPYATPNQYRFVNGEQLARSTLSTDYNLHTVSYIVNISSAQQPGYYATTMTYIATAAF